ATSTDSLLDNRCAIGPEHPRGSFDGSLLWYRSTGSRYVCSHPGWCQELDDNRWECVRNFHRHFYHAHALLCVLHTDCRSAHATRVRNHFVPSRPDTHCHNALNIWGDP